MHTRQLIRKAIYDRLKGHTGISTLLESNIKLLGEENLPLVNVMTKKEESTYLTDLWKERRTLQVEVVLYASHANGIANALDSLANTVEVLLSSDPTLGGVCENFSYKGCEPDYTSAASQGLALLTMHYECIYIWEPNPELDVMDTVSIAIDMASPRNDPQLPSHPDGQIDAMTIIHFPS